MHTNRTVTLILPQYAIVQKRRSAACTFGGDCTQTPVSISSPTRRAGRCEQLTWWGQAPRETLGGGGGGGEAPGLRHGGTFIIRQ